MATLDLSVRRRHKVPPQPAEPIWSVSMVPASVDEGDTLDWTVSADLNGFTPVADTLYFVTLYGMTGADFASQFPGETQASSSNGDYVAGFTAPFKAAIEALGGTGVVTTVNGITAIILGFKLATFTSVSIDRVTNDRPGDNGDRRSVAQILNQSIGTIGTAMDSCNIVDTFVDSPGGGGDAAAIFLRQDGLDRAFAYADCMGPGLSPASGTEVGRFIFKDAEGNILTPGGSALAFATDGDAGGRFAIVDAGSGSDRYRLQHTSTVADFEIGPSALLAPPQVPNYALTVIGTVNETVTQPLAIRRRYTAIAVTGNGTGTVNTYTSGDTFKTVLNQATSNRTIRTTATGVLRSTNTVKPILRGSNITVEGSSVSALRLRVGILSGVCNNVKFDNQAFGVGTDAATITFDRDIDNLEIGTETNSTTDFSKNILFVHCIFFASNDELMRCKWRSRRTMWYRCIFCYAFYPAFHTKTVVHNHGPAFSDAAAHGIAYKCLFWGLDTRMFESQGVHGFVEVNCIIGHWKDNEAGIRLKGGRQGLQNAVPCSYIAEANLFVPAINDATNRGGAIEVLYMPEAISNCYVAQTGDYANHFVHPATDNFSNDMLTFANGAITVVSSSSNAALKSEPDFEYSLSGYGDGVKMPTATEAQRRALWDDILDDVGNGSDLSAHVIAQARAGTSNLLVSPREFEAYFGNKASPNIWDGTHTTNKDPVAAATTANITLSGIQTINGVSNPASVLVNNQTALYENGVYTPAAGAWTRRADFANGTTDFIGSCFQVTGGTQAGIWSCGTNPRSGTVSLTAAEPPQRANTPHFEKAVGYGVC